MSDIDLSGALDGAFDLYLGLILLFAAIGSAGLAKVLTASNSLAAIVVGVVFFLVTAGIGFFIFIPFFSALGFYSFCVGPLLLAGYAIFGVTAWAFRRKR